MSTHGSSARSASRSSARPASGWPSGRTAATGSRSTALGGEVVDERRPGERRRRACPRAGRRRARAIGRSCVRRARSPGSRSRKARTTGGMHVVGDARRGSRRGGARPRRGRRAADRLGGTVGLGEHRRAPLRRSTSPGAVSVTPRGLRSRSTHAELRLERAHLLRERLLGDVQPRPRRAVRLPASATATKTADAAARAWSRADRFYARVTGCACDGAGSRGFCGRAVPGLAWRSWLPVPGSSPDARPASAASSRGRARARRPASSRRPAARDPRRPRRAGDPERVLAVAARRHPRPSRSPAAVAAAHRALRRASTWWSTTRLRLRRRRRGDRGRAPARR